MRSIAPSAVGATRPCWTGEPCVREASREPARILRSNKTSGLANVIRHPSAKLLSEVVAEYCALKRRTGRWGPRRALVQDFRFAAVVELIGDKPLRDVTKEDARALFRMVLRIPSRIPVRYPGLTVAKAIAAADK